MRWYSQRDTRAGFDIDSIVQAVNITTPGKMEKVVIWLGSSEGPGVTLTGVDAIQVWYELEHPKNPDNRYYPAV
jgi:hypothetical protein